MGARMPGCSLALEVTTRGQGLINLTSSLPVLEKGNSKQTHRPIKLDLDFHSKISNVDSFFFHFLFSLGPDRSLTYHRGGDVTPRK
jgi:hypothetical protein